MPGFRGFNGGRVLSVDAILCLLALFATTIAGSVLNSSVYAFVAGYYGIARELSNVFWALASLTVYFLAIYRPSLIHVRMFSLVALGSAAFAAFLLVLGLSSENAALTVCGFLFMDIAETWAGVMLASSLAELGARCQLACVAFAIALGSLLGAVVPAFDSRVGALAFVGVYALVIVVLFPLSRATLDAAAQEAAPTDLAVTNPESFPQPMSPLFTCVLLMGVATGFGLMFNAQVNMPVRSPVLGLALLVVAVWLMASKSRKKEDELFSFSVLAVVAGLIMILCGLTSAEFVSANVLLRIGSSSFNMLMWLVVLAIGRRNLLALLPTYALAQAWRAIGIDIGAVIGNVTNVVAVTGTRLPTVMTGVALFLFVAFLWVAFRSFSFSDTIRGVVGASSLPAVEEGNGIMTGEGAAGEADEAVGAVDVDGSIDAAPPASGGLDARVAALAEQHGLTARETEVFSLLARGRNGQYIMNSLVISKNTVKSHCARIYAKLGVHSQQELIDLVEAGE